MYTIGIIGSPSCGKSTIANALAGRMFSKTSRRRGTLVITEYSNTIHTNTTHTSKFNIIDFPPIKNEAGCDAMDMFMDNRHRIDIILLVVDAEHVDKYMRRRSVIRELVAERIRQGHYQSLIEVASKYDYPDAELDAIIGDMRRICALSLPMGDAGGAANTNSDTDWRAREYIKAARFRREMTPDEAEIMALREAGESVLRGRECTTIKYITDNGVANMAGICALLRGAPKTTPSIYMVAVAGVLRGRGICVQYLCLRACGEALGLCALDYLVYLPDSHLKCPVYAARGDRVMLARHLFTDDIDVAVPRDFTEIVPASVHISLIWGVTYAAICAEISVGVADIIAKITDPALRAYFELHTRSYEELIADIVADGGGEIGAVVTAAGVDWRRFRRQLASNYFTHGKRGDVREVVCGAAI